jgi:hypothetical protein
MNVTKNIKSGILTKKYIFASILLLMIMCCPLSAAASHPNLLFSDITEVPGYQYSSTAPWSTWKTVILRSADASLARDFSNPNWATHNRVSYRSGFAMDLGLAYQITKDQKYFNKARQALLNLDVGDVPYDMDRAASVSGYALAYDWVQPALTPADDKHIRDKLAILADRAYHDLNGDGAKKNYVSFADYHGQAYPSVAIAGLALEDYTNPNNIPVRSGPKDWVKAGTEYLFVNDKLHTYNRPLISYGFDETSGKHLLGSYKTYVISDLLWWFQVYSHYYDRNIFDDYPVAKKIATSELWETMPNGYMNNYGTGGNTLETYQRGILSLLNDQEKGEVLKYLDQTKGNKLLPYSRENDLASTKLLFCVFDNYDSINREKPGWTSRLDKDAIYQVFREGWQEDSDWLSLITFDVQTNSNRDSAHHDQLSLEYYGKGDLLLADAGETKYVLDHYYGQYGIHHNSIAIEDPRTPFAKSSWADSVARGVYKGNSGGMSTPATVDTVIQAPWMEAVAASATICDVIDADWSTSARLTSPIHYTRTVLYPGNDYFVIIDRLKSDQEWIYRNVLRPSSLKITPTLDKDGDRKYVESEIGHVEGSLSINGEAYDWLSLPYKHETNTNMKTNSINWETSNPYNRQVLLKIFSVPSSEIIITKHVGRIAGYGAPSEVFTPIVYLRSNPAKELSRITVLMSGYLNEEQNRADELLVTGSGNAMQINSAANRDTIYSGTGDASFDIFETDATMLFFRQPKNSADYYCMIRGGTYLTMDGEGLITISQTDGGMEATVHVPQSVIRWVKRDEISYTGFEELKNESAIRVFSDTDHAEFEIQSEKETAHIIFLNGWRSADPPQLSSCSHEMPGQKTGNIAMSLISGIIACIGLGWWSRRY